MTEGEELERALKKFHRIFFVRPSFPGDLLISICSIHVLSPLLLYLFREKHIDCHLNLEGFYLADIAIPLF